MRFPKGIEQLYMMSGQVFIRTSPAFFDKGCTAKLGELETPFSALPDFSSAAGALPVQLSFPLGETMALGSAQLLEGGTLPETPCEMTANTLEDWALENSQTLQVRVSDRDTPLELMLEDTLTLPPSKQALEFRAKLGVHRAQAELCVHVTDNATGETRVLSEPFTRKKAGGRSLEGYKPVALALPPLPQGGTLGLSLRYLRYHQTEEDNAPYLFVAQPEVVSPHYVAKATTPVRHFGKTLEGSGWYQATVPGPLTRSSGSLDVILGKEAFSALTPIQGQVRLEEDHGHSLIMTADQAGRYTIFLDGEAAFSAHIGTGHSMVQIPTRYLTGTTRHLAVYDQAGMQLFYETYVLLPRVLTPEDVMQRESRPPYPATLSAQAGHRYGTLSAHMANPGAAADMKQLSYTLSVLEGGYENVKLKPITFPEVAKPDVSIVIPAHNKVEVTYYGLCALLLAYNKASFEVIVVDDASTDETAELESFVSGITVIHNEEAQRFIKACNAGAAKARGKYVVLLNNDTEPTAGWLDALIDAFSRFDNVGLVGSKLLYPNGELQDAGGIIWGSGNPWNYGNRQNPWDPRFSYTRQADYLSGAALMTTKKIWDKLEGLSSYLEPMYFEDTDFSFKVREAGYKTYFVPSSVVYHFEGMTSGTDVTKGYKRYQEVNRPKFKRRWAKDYANFGSEGHMPDLEKDRGIVGRVLFIDYTTPRPDQDAGSYAAIQEIRLVQSLGYKVSFLPQNLAHLGTYTEELEKSGVEVITAPFTLSIPDFLEKRGAEFDAFFITRYYVGQATIDDIRRVAPHAKVILNNADLHFLRQLRAGLAHGDQGQVEAAKRVRDEELSVMRKADVVLSYNEVEHSVITSHTDGEVQVVKCPWVVDIPAKIPGLAKRKGLSFLGSFKHHPNVEGLEWFAETVMSQLETTRPNISLAVYGSGMNDKVRAMASDNIDPVGFVEEVADAYDRHRIFVAPLLSGAGIKGKVLAALAHGAPTVLTPVAAEGVGLRHGHDCMIAETPEEWAAAIVALSDDDALWKTMSENARSFVTELYSFEKGRKLMRAAFEAVDMFGSID